MVFPGQVIEIGGSGSQSQSSNSNTSQQSAGGNTHTVQSGESLDIIASKYGVSVEDIMSANNLNSYIIQPNQTLTIPGGTGVGGSGGTATGSTTTSNTGSTASDANLYDWGQCTWHVFNRRAETGRPISTYWWNADHWANNAAVMVIQ